ncbi:hypothetical protein PFICI_14028 [Pestalotiopsis fici W106-1]|uniref:Uncharacterized protein n=1 Tax=Pestalotiopsis fici (strain W106-1 / CGMCC3.15140) TaxID=1229662 RepID=W3WLV8_PESFW|nr:uncharacterized protein PFICI_14028 [Pestalotiopsis fici W106-1]ETS74162.1 hypothetical protein PFICI_14028 [Pestalotiopsis fici W106-1]
MSESDDSDYSPLTSESDDSDDYRPPQVPGIELPLEYTLPADKRFSHGLHDFQQRPRLVQREISILRVINEITDKQDWYQGVFDDEVVLSWKADATQDPLINDTAWDWCVAELQDKAHIYEEKQHVLVLDVASRVCKSDAVVPGSIRSLMKAATDPLRLEAGKTKMPEDQTWYNSQVIDLVNPSFLDLSFGNTHVFWWGGKTELDNLFGSSWIDCVEDQQDYYDRQDPCLGYLWNCWSQWLPSEVQFDDGTATGVRITSYINNLHPRNKTLYKMIEQVISLAIEHWNDVLVFGQNGRTPPRVKMSYSFDPPYPDWAENYAKSQDRDWKRHDPQRYEQVRKKVREYMNLPDGYNYKNEGGDVEHDPLLNPELDPRQSNPGIEPTTDPGLQDKIEQGYFDYIDDHGINETVMNKWKRIRSLVHPDAGDTYNYNDWKRGRLSNHIDNCTHHEQATHDYYTVDLRKDFREQGLQVVVKLSDIEVSPEKPECKGEDWHLASNLNEHVIGTAIYCYDCENIIEPCISFSTETRPQEGEVGNKELEMWELEQITKLFGIEKDLLWNVGVQELGSVAIPEGRLLSFPNTLWHRREPMRLNDKTRPGHWRCLVLYLVDPYYRICSTRNAPPQQQQWWAAEAYHKIDFSKFPPEILQIIMDEVGEGWPISSTRDGSRFASRSEYDNSRYYKILKRGIDPSTFPESTYNARWNCHEYNEV